MMACIFAASMRCLATERTVTTLADELQTPSGAALSLREAIRDSAAGDTIRFAPELNGGTIPGGFFTITKNLTIDALSLPDGVTLDGQGKYQLIAVQYTFGPLPVVTVRGLNFIRGVDNAVSNTGVLTLDHCRISDCSTRSGPPISTGANGGSLTMSHCSVRSNKPDSFGLSGGGALLVSGGSAKLTDCTLDGNESVVSAAISNYGTVDLIHCTVTNNRSSTYYGAITNYNILRLENSIIASNSSAQGPDGPVAFDVWNFGTIQASGKNFISCNATVATQLPTGPLAGTAAAPLDPQLAAAARQGGRTDCRLPLSGSPVLNKATNSTNTPATDQRDLARKIGAAADLGSTEANESFFSPANGSTALSVRQTLEWTHELSATSYRVWLGTAPGSLADMGSSTQGRFKLPELSPSTTYYWQIESTVAGVSTLGPVLSFTTRSHIEVTKTADETAANASTEPGVSLREAVMIANAAAGYDVIRFQAGLEGGLFQLASSLAISDEVRIAGDTLTGGITCTGGGFKTSAAAEFRNMTIEGTRPASASGPLDLSADFTAVNCTIAGNKSANGGALALRNGTCTLVHCTISGNQATLDGGGIYRSGGNLVLENCIVAGNHSLGTAQDIHATTGVTLRGRNLIGNNAGAETLLPAGPLTGTSQAPQAAALGPVAGHVTGKAWHCPLLSGSPAIGQALPLSTSPAGDEHGTPLPSAGADLGAVQRNAALEFFQPAAGAVDVSTVVTLLWNLPGESFQVYLGTSAGSLSPADSTTAGSLELSGLSQNTSYWWRVDATVNGSTVTGPPLSFTTRGDLVVTTAVDESDVNPADGTGLSLREAIQIARGRPGGNRILFSPGLPAPLPLQGGELRIETGVDIDASALAGGIRFLSSVGAYFNVIAGGELTLRRCELTGGLRNASSNSGGIIVSSNGSVRLLDCHLHHNQASFAGGAVSLGSARMIAERCTFDHNSATVLDGGALYSGSGILTLANCTFHANSASRSGAIYATGNVELVHCTISGNTATTASEPASGGIYFGSSGGVLENCIIAGNGSSDVRLSDPVIRGANLIGNNYTASAIFPAGSLVGTAESPLDPKLLPLGRYGGFPPTMPPRFGSPAIDVAPVATVPLATDQRGLPRVLGSSADLGAAEVFPLNQPLADSDSDGMDDRLETLYGFVVGVADGNGDADQDGSSNADELANRTDPTDPTSLLKVTSISQVQPPSEASGPVMRVTWVGFPGVPYTVELSQDLHFASGGGREIPAGTADSFTRTVDVPMLPGKDFLRIRRD